MSCGNPGCNLRAEFYCACQDQHIILCITHSNSHCQGAGMHKLIKLNVSLTNPERISMIRILVQQLSIIQEMKNKISEVTNQIVNNIYVQHYICIQEITIFEKKINSMISDIQLYNEVSQERYDLNIKIVQMEYTLDPQFYAYPGIHLPVTDFYAQNFLNSMKLRHVSESSLASIMTFFEQHSKSLVTLSIESLELLKTPLNLREKMGNSAGWCQLPQQKIFHYGGQLSKLRKPLNICCIIDPFKKTVEEKANGPALLYKIGQCTYFNNIVYIFGGSTLFSASCSEAYKYDLISDTWGEIAYLPNPSEHNCSVEIGGEIMITGCHLGIVKYQLAENTYATLVEKADGFKVMLTEGERFYLAFGSKLYLGENNKWELVGGDTSLPGDQYLCSYTVRHMSSIYFLLSNNCLYRFNLQSKHFERIKEYQIN